MTRFGYGAYKAQEESAIAVAVSGGADSLYSLLSLREQGFRVFALHGIFLHPENAAVAEAAVRMRERLAGACERLELPLHIVDLTDDFSTLVIRPFVESYALGLTPNPCALCNARIKFGLLLDAALALGATRLATGHYAWLEQEVAQVVPALFQGTDPGKDQSYFLSLVNANALRHALFPLGRSIKTEVMASLARHGLTAPQPGESQEVCFVPGDEYRDFVPRMAGRFGLTLPGPGPMLLRDDYRVGTHQGLWRYTEGQRKGLGVGWKEPLHVLGKEGETNILRLGPRDAMHFDGIVCKDVNILLPPEAWPERVLVKTRYRERPREAEVRMLTDDKGAKQELYIHFTRPDSAVAPGQIAAVYIPQEPNAPCGRDGFGPDASGPKASCGEKTPQALRLVAGGVIERAVPG